MEKVLKKSNMCRKERQVWSSNSIAKIQYYENITKRKLKSPKIWRKLKKRAKKSGSNKSLL